MDFTICCKYSTWKTSTCFAKNLDPFIRIFFWKNCIWKNCNFEHFVKVHIFWEGHKILRNLPLTQGAYYRRPRHSYYAMKAKQEPVSRFDISWYTWTKFLFTVCFSDFVTDFNLASCLCWAESCFLAGNRKWVGP